MAASRNHNTGMLSRRGDHASERSKDHSSHPTHTGPARGQWIHLKVMLLHVCQPAAADSSQKLSVAISRFSAGSAGQACDGGVARVERLRMSQLLRSPFTPHCTTLCELCTSKGYRTHRSITKVNSSAYHTSRRCHQPACTCSCVCRCGVLQEQLVASLHSA